MSLNYEMARYTELTGEDGTKVPISRLGGYLDGYEQGRTDAIDEFLIDVIYKIEFEEKWLMKAKSDNADTNVMFSCLKTFCKERAEQLKENKNE